MLPGRPAGADDARRGDGSQPPPRGVVNAFVRNGLRLAEKPVIFDLELHPYLKAVGEVAAFATGIGLFLLVFGLIAGAQRNQYRAD